VEERRGRRRVMRMKVIGRSKMKGRDEKKKRVKKETTEEWKERDKEKE
jgi:hypothetical protein